MDSDSITSATIIDIPDGNIATNDLFRGREMATETLKYTLMFVKLLNP